jgi:hypothetical protein
MVGWMVGFVNEYAKSVLNARLMGDTAFRQKVQSQRLLAFCFVQQQCAFTPLTSPFSQ